MKTAHHLQDELERALALAKRDDFDAPSAAALARARTLFAELSSAMDTSAFEVTVGEDGSIELFTATPSGERLTVEISAAAGRVGLVVQDAGGRVLAAVKEATDGEVVRRLERAA